MVNGMRMEQSLTSMQETEGCLPLWPIDIRNIHKHAQAIGLRIYEGFVDIY